MNRLLHRLLAWLADRRLAERAPTARTARQAELIGRRGISLGAHVVIHDHARLQCARWSDPRQFAGQIRLGAGTVIQPYAYLLSDGGSLTLGEHCSVNAFCFLHATGGLSIGNYVRIAAHTVIVTSAHRFDDPTRPIHAQGNTLEPVVIEDDVWIGAGVRIRGGVRIARGGVIGAGAVVTRDTEPWGVYAGVPARLIRKRSGAA